MTTTKPKTAKKPPDTGRPPAEQALRKALATQPQASAAELASAAGLGRSTASKALARLEQAGEVRRIRGAREGARRPPDRWTLATGEPAPDAAVASPTGHDKPASSRERLKPGELDGLILSYLEHNPTEPAGPSAIANALQRSAGAIANGLVRLARANKVQQVGERPLRYRIAS